MKSISHATARAPKSKRRPFIHGKPLTRQRAITIARGSVIKGLNRDIVEALVQLQQGTQSNQSELRRELTKARMRLDLCEENLNVIEEILADYLAGRIHLDGEITR